MANDSDKIEKLNSSLDLKRHALLMCEEKMAESSYSQTQNEISDLEKEIALHEEEKIILIQTIKKANDELKRLQIAQADMKKERENAMKLIEMEMKSAQNSASTIKKETTKLKVKHDVLVAEIDALTKDKSTVFQQHDDIEKNMLKMEEESLLLKQKIE